MGVPQARIDNDGLGLHVLVLRCQAGDERAFTCLLDRFGDRTLRYLRGLLGDDAEDVHQEVWLAVYKNLTSLADPSAFKTWLFRLTRHRAIDFLRSSRRQTIVFDEPPGPTFDISIDESVSRSDVLDRALMAIPSAQREVLMLKYRDDLTYEEMAMIIGIPIGTVRTRIHHGKRKLAELLKQGGVRR